MSYAVFRGRGRVAVASAVAAATALAMMVAPSYADHGDRSTPHERAQQGQAHPPPSIGALARQVERLHHEAEQASERYNTVRAQLEQAHQRLARVRADVADRQVTVATLHEGLAAQAVASFQGASLSTTVRLVAADDPDEFLTGLVTMESVTSDRAAMLASYRQQVRELSARRSRVHAQVAAITAAQRQASVERVALNQKAAQAEKLLSRLREEQRQARLEQRRQERQDARQLARQEARREAAAQASAAANAAAPSRSVTRAPATPAPAPAPAPSSGRGAAAVSFALAQLGDAYVYGATGPDAWDCSGLTMGAWAAAGVSIPHSSSMQTGVGPSVSTAALQPGDLVFYYSPISHVALYIGNGQVVHAANPSKPVEVVPLTAMPIAMAVRPG
ncbi:MAG TPA: NlpC/P60 family protein [Nocardioidaceae bacterium]|nr:NlpC/P60 family protein [Nocardioidaceae bacterium]